MPRFNFHGKRFALVANATNGKVNSDTVFEYAQDGNLVTADYHGGGIVYGKIIARLQNDTLHMRYQCLTEEGQLKAGKAIAQISLNAQQQIELDLDWEWLDGDASTGSSKYIEIG